MKRVVYKIVAPEGYYLPMTYNTRKEARIFLEGINYNTPSWHYDELYKMQAVVVVVRD